MDSLILSLFKAAEFAVIVAFTYFISDLRKKNQSSPLINEKLLTTIKLSYILPVAIYSYVILTLPSVSWFDVLALAITSSGTALTATALNRDFKAPCYDSIIDYNIGISRATAASWI